MNTVNWNKVKQLSRAQIMEENMNFSKITVLFIALFIIIWSLVIRSGDIIESSTAAARWCVTLPIVLPAVIFLSFMKSKLLLPCSYLEKYISAWIVSVWFVVLATLVLSAIVITGFTLIGTFFYEMPASEILLAMTLHNEIPFLLLTAFSLGILLGSISVHTTKRTKRTVLLGLVVAFIGFYLIRLLLSPLFEDHLVARIYAGIVSVIFLIGSYRLFKQVSFKEEKE